MQNLPTANSPVKITIYTVAKGILTQNEVRRVQFALKPAKTLIFIGLLVSIFSSCTSTRNNTYFQNLQKDTTLRNLAVKNFEPLIQKNDLLGITVASLSPDVAFYNAPQNTLGPLTGYLVNEAGNISFIKMGILHVEGLTRQQLKDTLQKGLIPYLKDVVISVGFLNRHVTLLGGLTPQILPMPAENMTILDALAAGGDIADKGRGDNILVIRETDNNSKTFKRINLTDNSVFYSPYFYLQPNDIVYVEPEKIKANNTAQILSYVTTGISFLIFILNQVFR